MNWKLSFDDAADIIDVYGPDDVFWPAENVDELKGMLESNAEFQEYVEDAKWLEQMLENWDENENGASIDWDDEDFTPGAAGPEERDDEDRPERPERPEPSDDADDQPDEPEADDAEEEEQAAVPVPVPAEPAEDEKEEAVVIDVDPDDLKDMDGMLQDFIRKQLENSDPTEFRVFTRDYDGMVDITMPDHVSLESIENRVAKTTGPLQKDLRRLIAARSQVKRIPGMRSGRLHAPNLHRIMAGDDRVFTRRQEAESLDTAISLLIDCSGSMNGESMVLATETAYAIGSVLAKLGIAFECLGFTDNGADKRILDRGYQREIAEADQIAKIIRGVPIIMPRFKAFEDRWTLPVQRRFAHVVNARGQSDSCGFRMGSTPEGCGLEFAARRLLARKEKRKILISMTDGEPGGHVYAARGMQDYFSYQQQSVNVVKAIEASGVDLVGVGILHDGPAGYYKNSMVIHRIEEMPKQLLALLKRFIVG